MALSACLAWPAQAADLRIFAAASLQGPLDLITKEWSQDVAVSYGGSGTLARQISLGAPADAVILANAQWSDWLVDQGHVAGPARPFLSNQLVLVGPNGAAPLPDPDADTLMARLGSGRMAMGQHMSVPAGIYAQAWLEHINVWTVLRPHLAETENVRAALALVARGEVPLGIVYASDAAASDGVDVVYTIPSDTHPPIQYPALAITSAGAAFLDHLATRTDLFVAAGFKALP